MIWRSSGDTAPWRLRHHWSSHSGRPISSATAPQFLRAKPTAVSPPPAEPGGSGGHRPTSPSQSTQSRSTGPGGPTMPPTAVFLHRFLRHLAVPRDMVLAPAAAAARPGPGPGAAGDLCLPGTAPEAVFPSPAAIAGHSSRSDTSAAERNARGVSEPTPECPAAMAADTHQTLAVGRRCAGDGGGGAW